MRNPGADSQAAPPPPDFASLNAGYGRLVRGSPRLTDGKVDHLYQSMLWSSLEGSARPPLFADDRRPAASAQDGLDRAGFQDRKHDDRRMVFTGKGKRGGVHDLEFP